MNIGVVIALIKQLAPKADPAVIAQAVDDYLDAHPEIEVADGSITEAKLAEEVANQLEEIPGIKNALQAKAPVITGNASGAIASFSDGADNLPIISLIAEIRATQAGTGTPSPTNVRSLTGATGLTIYHSGEDTSNPVSKSVSWETEAGTVYLGSIDLLTGLLTVTHAYKKYTGASGEEWVMLSNKRTAVITWDEVKHTAAPGGVVMCNMSPPNDEWVSPPDYGYVINNVSSYNIRATLIDSDMTVGQFKTWLSTHNLEIVCPLLNPVTYQLDPVELSTLLGINNIWSTSGNIVECVYRADTKKFVQSSDSLVSKIIGKKTFSIFKQVCCIGDSYMNGYISNSDGVARNNTAYSWVEYMKTMTGAEYVNCGKSGVTTKSWLTNADGLAKAQIPANKSQAYIIGLQINDASTSLDVGSVSDIGTTADTYYGYTSKIIDEMFAINDKAHIFVLNQPKDYVGVHTPYMEAIENIVAYYQNNGTHQGQVHLISLLDYIDLFTQAGCVDSRVDAHYTPVGYEIVAEIMLYALSNYMNKHPMLFRDVNLIPYGEGS